MNMMKSIQKKWSNSQTKTAFLALIILLIVIAILFHDTNFFTLTNFSNILLKAARNGGLLALGMTFVILTGEIDLSVGSVFALSGVVAGLVGQQHQLLGLLAGISVGVITGFVLGVMVTKMNISSWVGSLAMMFGLRGLILVLSRESIPLEGEILQFGKIRILQGIIPGLNNGIPILIILFLLIVLLCIFISKYTSFGLQLYSVGGNMLGARMMGINVDRVKILSFVLCGLIAATAGVFLASNSGSASLSAGNTYETMAIAMCAIGGVKLSGGVGKFTGTFLGIFIYFILDTVFTYMPNITTHWQTVIMGVLVLFSVAIQSEMFSSIKLNKVWRG